MYLAFDSCGLGGSCPGAKEGRTRSATFLDMIDREMVGGIGAGDKDSRMSFLSTSFRKARIVANWSSPSAASGRRD